MIFLGILFVIIGLIYLPVHKAEIARKAELSRANEVRRMHGRDDRFSFFVIFPRWIAFVLAIIPIGSSAIAFVPAGHVGVVDLFGNVSDTSLKPGMRFVNPLADVIYMNTQTQELTGVLVENFEYTAESVKLFNTNSSDGMEVDVDVSVLYRLDYDIAPDIYRTVGTDYPSTLIYPKVRSAVYNTITGYVGEDLYTQDARMRIQEEIFTRIDDVLASRGITLEQVNLRNIELPEAVTKIMEEKRLAEERITVEANQVLVAEQRKERAIINAQAEAEEVRIAADAEAYRLEQINEEVTAMTIAQKQAEALFEASRNAQTMWFDLRAFGDILKNIN